MLRRELLMLAVVGARGVPVDGEALNEFAVAYNAYVERLGEGVVDLDLWRKVERRWGKLVGVDHC